MDFSTRIGFILILTIFAVLHSPTLGLTQSIVPPSADLYLSELDVRSVSLSPDGTKVAYVKKNYSRTYDAVILDLDTDKILHIENELDGKHIARVQWLTNQRLAMTIVKRESVPVVKGRKVGFQYYPVVRLLTMDLYGKNRRVLLTQEKEIQNNFDLASIANALPNDPNHILVYAYDGAPCVYKVNVLTGRGTKFIQGSKNTAGWLFDQYSNPKIRLDFAPNSKKVKVYAVEQDGNKWSKIQEFRIEEIQEEFSKLIAGVSDSAEILLIDRKDADNYSALYKYDVQTKNLTKRVMGVEGHDIYNTIVMEQTGEVIGVSYYSDRTQFKYFDSDIQKVQNKLEKLYPNGMVQIQNVAHDKSRFLVFINEPWRPGEFIIYNNRTKKIRELVDLSEYLTNYDITSSTVINYPAEDGTIIQGFVTYPKDKNLSLLPTIIYPHGGPWARDSLVYDVFVQFWASRGYLVFQPNFRGSTGYGKRFQEAGNHEYGGLMIDDISAGIRALVSKGYTDPAKVCATGTSYGGYAALMLAVKTKLIKCAISVNGMSDLKFRIQNSLKRVKDREAKKELREYFDETMGNIKKQKQLLKEQSPINYAKSINVPVLLIHAKDDENVDVQHSKKMNSALKRAKKNVTYIELEDGGHNLQSFSARKRMLEETHAFIKQHIGPGWSEY